jgi:mono/diheme cytochrome c family protein
MNIKLIFCCISTVLLVSCGGGNSPGDVYPGQPPVVTPTTGPDSFLLFPNPIIQASGTPQIDSPEYARAYYDAIDPTGAKTTLAAWQAANSFNSGTGQQVTVVFGDIRDLGYGRRITARQNTDGTMAFSVENYLVPTLTGYSYSKLNLDAAIKQDKRWLIGSSNIEFSPNTPGGVNFSKFYFFNPDGQRATAVNLDGRGAKAMPGACITCHGGRGDPLTPAAGSPTGKALFPLVHNSASLQRGDVQGHASPLEVDTLDFSTTPGFTRAEQEANFKLLNSWILCSFPHPVGVAVQPEDVCRRPATLNEWQGGADALIKYGYGGNGMPAASYVSPAVPADWVAANQSALYQSAVAPSCRSCHILRGFGTGVGGSDVDLSTLSKFNGYSDQIKAHVFDQGDMPLAKIVSDDFWASGKVNALATYLTGLGKTVLDAVGNLLKPGRPIADAGPDRVVIGGATTLSALNSKYADNYQWSILSDPSGTASLTNPNTAQAIFNATANGMYVLQLIARKGLVPSTPVNLTVVVNNALLPAPSAIRFVDVKAVLQNASLVPLGCAVCHKATLSMTPITFDNVDRNADGLIDATDDLWLYEEVRGRINFTNIADSPLLLKATGSHHSVPGAGFDIAPTASGVPSVPGDPLRVNYDLFVNWILNGAPQ